MSAQTTSVAQPRPSKMYRMLRISGVLLIIGLLIEAISLHYNHPLSFLGFMFIGGAMLVFGVIIYLLSLVLLGGS
jgi:hypothetical protein